MPRVEPGDTRQRSRRRVEGVREVAVAGAIVPELGQPGGIPGAVGAVRPPSHHRIQGVSSPAVGPDDGVARLVAHSRTRSEAPAGQVVEPGEAEAAQAASPGASILAASRPLIRRC